ncbi:MAG: indolepyruvate ferredoxin oxidoreductase family protein [Pseudomonadota bacterium]
MPQDSSPVTSAAETGADADVELSLLDTETGTSAPNPFRQPGGTASLNDKFDLERAHVLLNGAQAIVRLALMLRARDVAAGHNTAGYVSGYRGSPITSLEAQFARAGTLVAENEIVFHPGLNEDLAATAIWGSQQAELRGEGKYDGVFGIWYGKGPGVDRSGDVFRHANHAGTSRLGGVLALMGDDHTCESSTSAHQSEFAFVDAMIPVLNPAGVQEILDYGMLGIALSRYAGVWVGIKCVKDNVEATATVDGRSERVTVKSPTDHDLPEGGLNIRLGDTPLDKEARLHDHKRDAILAFARANTLDELVMRGGARPRIGIVSTGKSYLDTRQALDELGIDEVRASELGVRLYKVAMSWPLEPEGIRQFAEGLDLVVVVEEKRSLIETQIKEQLYGLADAPVVIGKQDERGHSLFPAKGALEPLDVALEIGTRLQTRGGDEALAAQLDLLKRTRGNAPEGKEISSRIPYFCAGCPHNSSTVVPDGSRAYAGIGCHYMALWMDRSTEGFTQMGAEGTNWIGESPFSTRDHVFQNLGDGTYTHSGSLAVRASVAAGVNVTYKILYNDAVAMTGGQTLDGAITVPQIARQMAAEGVSRVVVVTDEPDKYPRSAGFPQGTAVEHRSELGRVQRELAETTGVSVMIYDQTCAAEKRRRRKRGLFPDPPKRAFINTAVCEGCGDCGEKSNCVAIVPVETELGRKRAIDQSTCNKDFSCVDGFCPSFVTVHGGALRKPEARDIADDLDARAAELGEPELPTLDDASYSVVVTGVGGTGVVTISAILGQAAYIDGHGFGAIDMAGLAQKGGAVACHIRFAKTPDAIHSIRAGIGGADVVLGCDLVVTGSHKVLETVRGGHTRIALNSHEMITGDFTKNPELELPAMRIRNAVRDASGEGGTAIVDAHHYAVRLFGDSIASNMFMLGFAWQQGMVPVSRAAILEAIRLNGAAVEMNAQAFAAGRIAAQDRAFVEALAGAPEEKQPEQLETLDAVVAHRAAHLAAYQDSALGEKFSARITSIAAREAQVMPGSQALALAAARAYAKVLAYKDEYEVARLYTDGAFHGALAAQFSGDYTLEFHLAPPLVSETDPETGHAKKKTFGPWMMRLFRLLARLKGLRGTRWDVFGYTAERRAERAAITDYEVLLDLIEARLSPANHAVAVELAELPLSVRGFGHVKEKNAKAADARRQLLLPRLDASAPTSSSAKAA